MKACRLAFVATAVVLPMVLRGADAPAPGTARIQFATRPTGKNYSPKHVLAVWVTDAKGNFVRTLMLRAQRQRKALRFWQKASGGNTTGLTDAVSGATAKQHQPIRLDWDCRDTAGNRVPNGSYVIMIEFSERSRGGPVTPAGYIPLEVGSLPFSVTPRNLEFIGDVRVTFAPVQG